MVLLALLVTAPVFLGVAAAGWVGIRADLAGVWIALFIALICSVLVWGGLGWSGSAPFTQRYLAPLSIYIPPLALAGIGLTILGRPRWRVRPILVLALALAIANLFLAQFFFASGCSLQLWDCP
jgi:hypothetical protein